jgi:hypothetical protein
MRSMKTVFHPRFNQQCLCQPTRASGGYDEESWRIAATLAG